MRRRIRSEPARAGARPIRIASLLPIVGLLVFSGACVAQDSERAGLPAENEIPITMTGSVKEDSREITLTAQGAIDVPDDAAVTLYFSSAVDPTPLSKSEVKVKAGRFSYGFGPFEELAEGNYLVRAVFAPWKQAEGIRGAIKPESRTIPSKGQVVIPFRTKLDAAGQEAANLSEVNAQIREIRSLFVELEKQVTAFRALFEKTHDSEKAQKWFDEWRRRVEALHSTFQGRQKHLEFGSPYGSQTELLFALSDRLGYYGDRYSQRIVGEERLASGDSGKSMDELARSGRLPSGMIRTQFFETLRALSSVVPYEDPNRADVGTARPKLISSFVLLFDAYQTLEKKAAAPDAKPITRHEWESALARYRQERESAEEACQNVLLFCETRKNRQTSSEKAQLDSAAGVLQIRDSLDALAKALEAVLIEKKGGDRIASLTDETIATLFRPAVAEIAQDLRRAADTTEASFNGVKDRRTSNRTRPLAVLNSIAEKGLSPTRDKIDELGRALRPIDPESYAVRHYTSWTAKAREVCDRIRDFAKEARDRYADFMDEAKPHPAVTAIQEALDALEAGLSPPAKAPPR